MNSGVITRAKFEKYGDALFKGSLFLFILFVPFSITVTEGAFWLAFIGYIMNRLSNNKPIFSSAGIEKPIAAFLAALVFTSLFSLNPFYSLSSISAFRFLALYYMLANYDLEEDYIHKLVVLIILMSFAWCIYEIYRYYKTEASRLHVYTAHINSLVIPIIFGLIFFGRTGIKRKVLLSVILAVLGVASLLSFSRAAWLGTFAALSVVMYYRSWKVLMSGLAISLIAIFAIVAFLPDSPVGSLVNSTIRPFQAEGARYGSNIERFHMLQDTLAILKDDPLTGIGPEAYRFVSTDKHMRISMDWIQALATTGLIGFIAYLWLISAFIRRCYTIERMESEIEHFSFNHVLSICLFAALVGFLVCGSFEPMFFSTKRFRFMMLLLGINEALSIKDQKV